MVVLESHGCLASDRDAQVDAIGEEFFDLRSPHLAELQGLEALVRATAPLPVSYDVGRIQPPHFHEFTYTEGLGCLMVSPQSREAAARLAAGTARHARFSVADAIEARLRSGEPADKYRLDAPLNPAATKIAFIPGSNIFGTMVSRELFTRTLTEDPEIFIKPHPITDERLIRHLGREFGYHRLLDPRSSGVAYLAQAERVYTTTTSELGLFAVLMGVPISNIGNYINESGGIYHHFYRLVFGLEPARAREDLRAALDSETAGLLHPDDPDPERRLRHFFARAMSVREMLKPFVNEISPIAWGEHLTMHQPEGTPGAVRERLPRNQDP